MTPEPMFSYVIPTIGRPSLDAAVTSVLTQDLSRSEIEVVVVNDSGSPLERAGWLTSQNVKIINTNRCERSFARNSGAAVARGQYIAFLDDDDWILPGALNTFKQLAGEHPEAVWLYGGIQIVDEHHNILAEINSGLHGSCFSQIMGGAWAPLQASMIQSRAFFAVGGFDPFICGTEDEDLCRRIAYLGKFANTPKTVACLYRGQSWNTSTNYLRAPEDTKYSRDLILSQPGTFQRLRSSASSSYWQGRNLRIYLSTFVWNIKKRRGFTAVSRIVYGLVMLGCSIGRVISRDYWAGLRAHHVPETLHFVMAKYEEKNRSRNL